MYRPDEWDKLKTDVFGEVAIHTTHEEFLFEAGADAMLRAVVEFIGGVFSEAKWEALKRGIDEEVSDNIC